MSAEAENGIAPLETVTQGFEDVIEMRDEDQSKKCKQRDKKKTKLVSQLSSSVNSETEKLGKAWKRKDYPAMRQLIYEKVKAEDYSQEETCHLNDKIFEKENKEMGETSESVQKKTKKVERKVKQAMENGVKLGKQVIEVVIEMRDEDENRKSFMEDYFDSDQDVEEKLKKLKPSESEWTGKNPRKELKCFYRIFLTAAAREMRHGIVDKMLHVISHDEMLQVSK